MPDIPEYRVFSDGTGPGTRIYADEEELTCIKTAAVFFYANSLAELVLEVNIAKLEFIGKEVEFTGLGEVPTEALKQELERREES